MKSITLFLIFLTSTSTACDMSSDEQLVCEFILCNPMGILNPDSRNEYMDVNRRFGLYLAGLGFWSEPPKCRTRDKQCNVEGTISADTSLVDSTFCESLGNEDSINACLAAIGMATDDYCNSFDEPQRTQCFDSQGGQ